MISELKENQNVYLEQSIFEGKGKIISLSANMRLTQERPGRFDRPEYLVCLDLQSIDIKLHKLQMQQVIQLAEFVASFQHQLEKQNQLNLIISPEQLCE